MIKQIRCCYHQLISDPPPTDFLTHLTGINTP
jgi:hypothetical protein